MLLILEKKDKKHIISIKGQFFKIDEAREFKKLLMKQFLEDVEEIVVDMSNVLMLDSISVGVLVHAQTVCMHEGVGFSIINVNNDILELFKQVKLDKILKVYPCVEIVD